MALNAALQAPFETDAPAPIAVARPRLPDASAITSYIERIDQRRWYSNFGPLLHEFEGRLADRLGPGAGVASCVNATQGLTLALRAMDAPRGSFCALPSWTFVATAHAVAQAGMIPWFVDVDPQTWMLDPVRLQAQLANAPGQVGAVIPVAPFGAMPDLNAWRAFRHQTGLRVLIDAAAAFDALASAELPAVVSLHATKTLGIGEGGFLASNDPVLIERFRQLTSFGFRGSRESEFVATNAKLSEYAAAVGLAAMDGWAHERGAWLRAAQLMRIALMPLDAVRLQPGWGRDWVSSVCVVQLPEGAADRVEAGLAAEGIETRRWWGHGCHRSPAFADCLHASLSATELLAGSTLGLPFACDLSAEHAGRIGSAIARAL